VQESLYLESDQAVEKAVKKLELHGCKEGLEGAEYLIL
jgi:hypothetical protein